MSTDFSPVKIPLPSAWETWRQLTEMDLEVPSPEGAFVGVPVMVWLPGITHRELQGQAEAAGWTYGQLLGYLTIWGILHSARQQPTGE